MLKDQNVILNDPEPQIEAINVEIPPRLATFEDEEKSLLLSQLLKSNKKDDLYAANQLIKSMVRSVSFIFLLLFFDFAIFLFDIQSMLR